jgi:rare lipoprotein A
VRVNDRGPFASNRVIDLSRTAAQELDIVRNGTARVRIEQLQAESLAVKDVAINGGGPAEQHQALAQLASGKLPPQQPPQQVMATAPPAAAPPSAPVQAGWPANPRNSAVAQAQTSSIPSGNGGPTIASLASAPPTASGGGFYVQTGSFSTAENAERQRGAVRSYGSSEISQASASGRDVYRVRLGPYTTSDAAGIVADRLKRSGYGDARVVGD